MAQDYAWWKSLTPEERQKYGAGIDGETIDLWNKKLGQAEMDKQAYDFFHSISPSQMPDYMSAVDENGNLKSAYQLTGQPDIAFNYNRGYLDKLGDYATSTGNSPCADLMLQKQGVEQGQKLDAFNRNANASRASAWSGMATHGGIRSGAKERLATKSARDMMTGRNDIFRQGELDRLGIQTTDQGNKLDVLKALPGAELNVSNAEFNAANTNRNYATDIMKTNLDTRLKDLGNRNQFAQDKWKTNMSTWAAERQAQATENAGKK